MIKRLIPFIRADYDYDDPFVAQRARGLMVFFVVSLGIGALRFLLDLTFSPASFAEQINPVAWIGAAVGSPLLLLLFHWITRQGYYRIAAIVITLIPLVILAFAPFDIFSVRVVAVVLPILLSGLLLNWRWTVLITAGMILISARLIFSTLPFDEGVPELISLTMTLIAITTLIIATSSGTQLVGIRAVDDLKKLQAAMGSINGLALALSPVDMSKRMIDIFQDNLNIAFARIYLVEDGTIVQRIQAGQVFDQADTESVSKLSKNSALYQAIRERSQVMLEQAQDESPFVQHLLKSTTHALVLPIVNADEQVIALLDIQHDRAFRARDLQFIDLIAQHYRRLLNDKYNTRDVQKQLVASKDLIASQSEKLSQYEAAEQRATANRWTDYLKQRGINYMGFDILDATGNPTEGSQLTEDIQAAIQTGDILIEQKGDHQAISVPIQLRGQALGGMSFLVPSGRTNIGERQQELIQNVVQRLSLALENKRLFEQSQSQAEREKQANEVGNILLSSTDVNTVLELAAENFNAVLGAIQTQIQIRPVDTLQESETLS